MKKLQDYFKSIPPNKLLQFKVYGIGGVGFLILTIVIYIFLFADSKEELTEIQIPEAKKVEQYNSKLDAVSRNKSTVSYNDDINKYFENVDLTSKKETTSNDLNFPIPPEIEDKSIYNDEDRKMDSLMKVFEKQNKVVNTPKINKASPVQQQKQSYVEPVVEKVIELTAEEKRKLAREKRRTELAQGSRSKTNNQLPKSISASIRGTQTLKAGGTLRLISNNEFSVKNVIIPKNTYLYGTVSFTNNKAEISIQVINLNNQVIPCNLIVHSANGTKGIDLDIDTNINRGKNSAVSQGANEISGGYGNAVGILTDVVRGKASELKVTFTDNQKVLLVSNEK